jgi:hypothetical protein
MSFIATLQTSGRKAEIFTICNACGNRTQTIWIFNTDLFKEGKERNAAARENRKAIKGLLDCSDFANRPHNRHLCASCVGAIRRAIQLPLFEIGTPNRQPKPKAPRKSKKQKDKELADARSKELDSVAAAMVRQVKAFVKRNARKSRAA